MWVWSQKGMVVVITDVSGGSEWLEWWWTLNGWSGQVGKVFVVGR